MVHLRGIMGHLRGIMGHPWGIMGHPRGIGTSEGYLRDIGISEGIRWFLMGIGIYPSGCLEDIGYWGI